MDMKGYTIEEMAEILKITEEAVYLRILKKQIKPLTKKAVYPMSTLKEIKVVSKGGRPKKT